MGHLFSGIRWLSLLTGLRSLATRLPCLPQDPLQAHVIAPTAAPAANWILKKQEVFDVLQAKPGWTQSGRGALNTFQRNHQPYSRAFLRRSPVNFRQDHAPTLSLLRCAKRKQGCPGKWNVAYFRFVEKGAPLTEEPRRVPPPEAPLHGCTILCGLSLRSQEQLIRGPAAPNASDSPNLWGDVALMRTVSSTSNLDLFACRRYNRNDGSGDQIRLTVETYCRSRLPLYTPRINLAHPVYVRRQLGSVSGM
jgi:hypothetical protein